MDEYDSTDSGLLLLIKEVIYFSFSSVFRPNGNVTTITVGKSEKKGNTGLMKMDCDIFSPLMSSEGGYYFLLLFREVF